MRLSMHILATDLNDLMTSAQLVSPVDQRSCASVRLLEAGQRMDRSFFYIAQGSSLDCIPEHEEHSSLICIGNPLVDFQGTLLDVLVVQKECTLENLLDRIATLFSRYEEWDDSLRAVVDNKKSIDLLGQISEPIFKNPLYCQASGFKCVFLQLGKLDTAEPELRKWMLEVFGGKRTLKPGDYLPLEGIDRLLANQSYIEASNAEGPAILNYKGSPGETYFINIGPVGAHVARVCVFEVYHALTSRDMALLCVLANHIDLAMRSANLAGYDAPSLLEQVSRDLLSRQTVSEELIHRALAELGWHMADSFFCMSLTSITGDTTWQTLQTTATYINERLPEHFHMVFEDKLLYVFDLSAHDANYNSVLKQVDPIFRDAMLRSGSSGTFDNFTHLPFYYWQANKAFELGSRHNPNSWHHHYKDYNAESILERISGGFPSEVFAPEGLQVLSRYDKAHGANLVATLRTYLECNCGIVETARRLFISRSACIYRISRIQEIGKMDLDNSETRFELIVAFQLSKEGPEN